MGPERPTLKNYFTAVFLIGLSSYPYFIALQSVRSLPVESLVPCNDKPCSYTKIFHSSGIESTGFSWASVQNGIQDVNRSSNNLVPTTVWDAVFGGGEHVPQHLPALCPNKTPEQMRTICDDPQSRHNIRSGLKFGTSGLVCAVCLFLWANTMIAHDWLLMSDFSELVTISVGRCSCICLDFSAGASFLFAMSANEIFVSDVSDQSIGECGCYYKMPPLPALLTLASPFLLWYTSFCRYKALTLSMMNGDSLYFMKFDVPYHLVRHSQGWSSGTLQVPKVAGSITAPHQCRTESPTLYSKLVFPLLFTPWCTLVVLVAIALASFGVFPKYMEFLLTEAMNQAGGAFLLRLLVTALAHGPFALGLTDSLVRFQALPTFAGDRVGLAIKACLGLLNSLTLMPPWAPIGAHHSLSLNQLNEWGRSSMVLVLFLWFRFGITNALFGDEDSEIVMLSRSGLHIPAVKSDLSKSQRKELVDRSGIILQCPEKMVAFGKRNPITASMYLEKEMQCATKFLEDHPSYNSKTDKEEWQSCQAEMRSIRPLMEDLAAP